MAGPGLAAEHAERRAAASARVRARKHGQEREQEGRALLTELRMYPGTGSDERTSFAPYSAFDVPADLRELHGRYDVEAVARRVRNFRYAEEWIMTLLGGWIATIPELPVKVGLGRIIWETAQAADRFGARLPELRCGTRSATASEAPNEGFAAFIRSVAEPESPVETIEKLVGIFDVLLPHLVETYERTVAETDPIADAPTIRILEESPRGQGASCRVGAGGARRAVPGGGRGRAAGGAPRAARSGASRVRGRHGRMGAGGADRRGRRPRRDGRAPMTVSLAPRPRLAGEA